MLYEMHRVIIRNRRSGKTRIEFPLHDAFTQRLKLLFGKTVPTGLLTPPQLERFRELVTMVLRKNDEVILETETRQTFGFWIDPSGTLLPVFGRAGHREVLLTNRFNINFGDPVPDELLNTDKTRERCIREGWISVRFLTERSFQAAYSSRAITKEARTELASLLDESKYREGFIIEDIDYDVPLIQTHFYVKARQAVGKIRIAKDKYGNAVQPVSPPTAD